MPRQPAASTAYVDHEAVEMAIDAGPFESDTIWPAPGNVLLAARFASWGGSSVALESVRVIDPSGGEHVPIGAGIFSRDSFTDSPRPTSTRASIRRRTSAGSEIGSGVTLSRSRRLEG